MGSELKSAELQALLTAEVRLARLLGQIAGAQDGQIVPDVIRSILVHEPREAANFGPDYYQRQHEDTGLYQQNNWLMDAVETIAAVRPDSVIELGCGNGKFAREISAYVGSVIAVDWAKSPLTENLPANCRFVKADLIRDKLPKAALACSADVLEHISFDRLGATIARVLALAPLQHHVIACYDDGGSHLSVMPPGVWLYLFRRHSSIFRLESIEVRRNDPKQLVCTITNLPEAEK